MAKTKIEQLMDLDDVTLDSMSIKEIKKVTSYLNKQANQRVRRLKENKIGVLSPALYKKNTFRVIANSDSSFRKFSNKGIKTKSSAVNAFQSVKNFLSSKTSTNPGYKRFLNEYYEKTGIDKLSLDQKARFFATGRLDKDMLDTIRDGEEIIRNERDDIDTNPEAQVYDFSFWDYIHEIRDKKGKEFLSNNFYDFQDMYIENAGIESKAFFNERMSEMYNSYYIDKIDKLNKELKDFDDFASEYMDEDDLPF